MDRQLGAACGPRRQPRWWVMLAGVVLVAAGVLLAAWGAGAQSGHGGVVVIQIDREITRGTTAMVQRAVNLAAEQDASAILVSINTPGGEVDATLAIVDLLTEAEIPRAAYVHRGWSAGALIALANETIIMASGGSIGSAEPRPADAKTISAVRAEFETIAIDHGHDPQLAAAMVDSLIAIEGVVGDNEILNLTASQAADLGLAEAVVDSRAGALEHMGWQGLEETVVTVSTLETLSGWLTHPWIAPLLFSLGLLLILLEMLFPGTYLLGFTGLLLLGLFFGGHLIAGLTGWEAVVLAGVGLLLLLMEAAAPGFGIFGLAGLGLLAGSVIIAADDVTRGLTYVSVAVIFTPVAGFLALKLLPRSRVWDRIFLPDRLGTDEGYVAHEDRDELVGRQGTAVTGMRPSGTIMIDDVRHDAVSEGDFIERGARVRVVAAEGMRLVVRKIDEADTGDAAG